MTGCWILPIHSHPHPYGYCDLSFEKTYHQNCFYCETCCSYFCSIKDHILVGIHDRNRNTSQPLIPDLEYNNGDADAIVLCVVSGASGETMRALLIFFCLAAAVSSFVSTFYMRWINAFFISLCDGLGVRFCHFVLIYWWIGLYFWSETYEIVVQDWKKILPKLLI
jgi:hypothetical protein